MGSFSVLRFRVNKRIKAIYADVACVASVSNRVIARKLERKQKKVEGGGEKRKRLPANPTILENALDISRFGSFVN